LLPRLHQGRGVIKIKVLVGEENRPDDVLVILVVTELVDDLLRVAPVSLVAVTI
jgi:hypothetical protein